ncbi:glycosyltransferase family 4 protein [Arenibacter sp. F26102]|nr:glycosyltransferase family 4 protein [Arenibacter sp. F26102]
MKKKIAVAFLSIYQGGSENHKYLKPIFSKPSILVNWFIKNKKDAKIPKNRYFLRKYHLSSFRQCKRIYNEFNPDIVIIRNLRLLISIQHLIIGLILRKKIFIYSLNNYRQNIGFSRKLVANTLKLFGVKHYTPVFGDVSKPVMPNTYYIPMVMDKLVVKESILSKIYNPGIQIATVGKMVERKKLRELVESLIRIKFFDNRENKLIIISECIGEKHEQYLDTIPKKENQIIFHLNIKHEIVFKLYESSDLFILPSFNEPAGTSLVEALASGLAVVCSDTNGTKGYIDEGINGHVFKSTEDFYDLDMVLSKIMDKNLLINYGMESLRIIEENHSIDKFYDLVINNGY